MKKQKIKLIYALKVCMLLIICIITFLSFSACQKTEEDEDNTPSTPSQPTIMTSLPLIYSITNVTIKENTHLFKDNTYAYKVYVKVKNNNDITKTLNANKYEVGFKVSNTQYRELNKDWKFNDSDITIQVAANSSSTFYFAFTIDKSIYKSYNTHPIVIVTDNKYVATWS